MHVTPAAAADLSAVRAVYHEGARLQRAAGGAVWPPFPDKAILAEIRERRLMRVDGADGHIGVFTVAYEDPLIWGERERGRHLYLHRIARAPGAEARGLTAAVVAWAFAEARRRGFEGVRLDTWADNERLTAHYERAGFVRVGRTAIPSGAPLLPHYAGIEVVLLEAPLRDPTPSESMDAPVGE